MRRGLKIWVEGRMQPSVLPPVPWRSNPRKCCVHASKGCFSPHSGGLRRLEKGRLRSQVEERVWKVSSAAAAFFFFFFNGRSFIHHKLHHFKVNPSMIFSIFNKLRTHHHYLIPKNFHHPKKIPCTHQQLSCCLLKKRKRRHHIESYSGLTLTPPSSPLPLFC